MRLVACILAVVVNSMSASASLLEVYSTFGPGDSFSNDGAASIGGTGSIPGGFQSMANAFTVSGGDFQLGSIDLAAAWMGGANSLSVSLAADNGGLPGTTIESFSLSGLMTEMPGSILTVFSETHPYLSDGSSYWLVAEAGAADTAAAWWDSLPHVEGKTAWDDGTGWRSNASGGLQAFRVSAIPEPTTVSLLFLGGLGLLRRKRG